jgi:hypothetical protein
MREIVLLQERRIEAQGTHGGDLDVVAIGRTQAVAAPQKLRGDHPEGRHDTRLGAHTAKRRTFAAGI